MKKNKVKDQFLAELRKIPIIQVAAEKTNLSRQSIYRWKSEDKEFCSALEEALAEGEALINDLTESQLLSLIKEKSWPAISFWLKHRHKKFSDKIEVITRMEDGEEKLTTEQEKFVRNALALGGIITPNKNNHD